MIIPISVCYCLELHSAITIYGECKVYQAKLFPGEFTTKILENNVRENIG